MSTDPQSPPRDRLFALIASIPGSGTFDWCSPARALLDEIAAMPAAPPTGQAGLRDRIADAVVPLLLDTLPKVIARARGYEVADAVLSVLFGPIPAGTDTATWTAIRAIQLMNQAGKQRDASAEAHCLALAAWTPGPVALARSAEWASQQRAATVDPAMCPRCKGDNSEAFELCSRCTTPLAVLPATAEPHRLALSTALGLGTSAPWDAIRVRAAELAGQGGAGGRAAVLREAATIVRSMDSDYALQEAAEHLDGLAVDADEADGPRRLAAETPGPETQGGPRRGDEFEAWLKAQRDEYGPGSLQWPGLDDLLDQYRLHADTGTPLGEHVCEGRAVGDCDVDEKPLLCPRCGNDITDYAEDDFVFRTGDERPYCSGECVIAAHRAGLPTGQRPDDYEATTGHAITCLSVAGGASDPDCPACHPKFGIDGCTCIPFTRQDGTPRYCGPTDTVDMISGWEPGGDCPHHAPAVVAEPGKGNDTDPHCGSTHRFEHHGIARCGRPPQHAAVHLGHADDGTLCEWPAAVLPGKDPS